MPVCFITRALQITWNARGESKNYPDAHFYYLGSEGNVTVEDIKGYLDDGTDSNENRLGAVRDIGFALEAASVDGDALILAGDNLLDFSLCTFVNYGVTHGASCVMRYYEPDLKRLSKSGVLVIDDKDRVEVMQEKPSVPLSNWCCPPFYFLTRGDTKRVFEAILDGCNADAPGGFIEWLVSRSLVYAMEMPGKRYDIGTLESYERVKREYVMPF